MGRWSLFFPAFLCMLSLLLGRDADINKSYAWTLYDSPENRIDYALRCLVPENIRNLKSLTDKAGLRAETLRLFYKCEKELFEERIPGRISGELVSEEKLAIFSTILSHYSAPYGNCAETELFPLLKANRMHCNSYALLAVELFENAAGDHEGDMIFLGFTGGYIWDHLQLMFRNTKHSLLLDPTVGIVAFVSYNDLLKGKHVNEKLFFPFYAQGEVQAPYFLRVKKALLKGLYKPSDALFYYVGLDNFRHGPKDPNQLPTPGAVHFHKKNSSSDFTANEFKDEKEIRALCGSIHKDAYMDKLHDVACAEAMEPYDIIIRLNEILRITDFYDIWILKNKTVALSGEIKGLIKDTSDYRFKGLKYMTKPQRDKIIRLNRLLLETSYPQTCPRSRVEESLLSGDGSR